MKRALALCGLLGVAAAALAQPQLSTNEVVFNSGNWYVVRSFRATSGKTGCTGFYQQQREVQLSSDELIVKVPGELRQVVIRFGDELSQPARKPSKAEMQMGAVVIGGEQFDKLLTSRKLALEITTKTERTATVLRLNGLREALDNIRAGCPAPDRPVVICSDALLERMRSNGVTPEQVKAICR
jgi:hypothetical protein